MSAVVDYISDVSTSAWNAVSDAVVKVWHEVALPLIEFVFAAFGIVDEDVIFVQKNSTPLFIANDIDVVHQANVKAVMSMVKVGGSFFPWYMNYTRATKNQIKAFYRFAEQGRYIHGLPSMVISGIQTNDAAVDAALVIEIPEPSTRLDTIINTPSNEIYFKNKLQEAPYNYIPWSNTLTFTDPNGIDRNDYTFNSVSFNNVTSNYEISISREAAEASFWLEGSVTVVEGDYATYIIKCNRRVPVGKSVTINMGYSGTAPAEDYSEVLIAVMTEGNKEVSITVNTNEDTVSQGSRTIIASIESIVNTDTVFEAVAIYTLNTVTTTITDDEGIILTMASAVVAEDAGSVTIPVKLEAATAESFTVNYAMLDGTAIGGIDFNNTSGVLSFSGNVGEIQNIVIPIIDNTGTDYETFTVYFTKCSDVTVNISQTAIVTITNDYYSPVYATDITIENLIIEPNYVEEGSLVVTYHLNTDPSEEWFYWIYIISTGTYPDIFPASATVSNLEMLPVAIIKRDGLDIDEDKTTEEYKTTKRFLDTLELDIDNILENVKENPSYELVQDMYINFSVCPSSIDDPLTNIEIVSKTLWLTFYNIIVVNPVTSNTDQYTATFEEQNVNNAMVWTHGSYTENIEGTLTNNQEYHHEIAVISVEDLNKNNALFIRHQESPGFYSELKIVNLSSMSAIKKDGYHEVTVSALGKLTFTIPISHFVINELDPLDQMRVYQHILRLDSYSAEIVEIAFYESDLFLQLFELSMAIVTVYSLGSASGPVELLKALVYRYLVTELVRYIADLTDNAALAALVGMLAMIALSPDGFEGFEMGDAEDLILASTNFSNNLTTVYNDEMADLQNDLNALNEEVKDRLESINEAGINENPITAAFLVSLNSYETGVFPAIKAQYDYDLLYNYDRLIADYHDFNLQAGIV